MSGAPIAILLPTYNGAAFLRAQIESVLAQSFADFDLLIHDDGSTDDTWSIIAEVAERDRRIQASRSENRGQNAVLRDLVQKSTSPWIAFCDQDDIWDGQKLADLVRRRAAGVSLVYGRSRLIDASGHGLGPDLLDWIGEPFEGTGRVLDLMGGNRVSGHAMLVDRRYVTPAAFAGIALYDWTIAVVAAAHGAIVYEPKSVTHHRIHDGNQVNRRFATERRPRHETTLTDRIEQFLRALSEVEDSRFPVPVLQEFQEICCAFERSWKLVVHDRRIMAGARAAAEILGEGGAEWQRNVRKAARGNLHPRVMAQFLRRSLAGLPTLSHPNRI